MTPLLNFYSQADPYKLTHVDDYSLKLNFARTTKFKYINLNQGFNGIRTRGHGFESRVFLVLQIENILQRLVKTT